MTGTRALSFADIAAFLWASITLRTTREWSATRQLEGSRPPRPPRWIHRGHRGFDAARSRHRSTCLVDAHLRQGWLAAHGDHRLLYIGLRPSAEGFSFHAWLAGDEDELQHTVLATRTTDGQLLRSTDIADRTRAPEPDRAKRRLPGMVTVIIPAFNCEQTIAAQIEALTSQTYRGAWELVIVDDASTDQTPEVTAEAVRRLSHPVRQVRNDHHEGCCSARNLGARVAEGDLLAFCDADDVVSPMWLDRLVHAAEHADVVGGFLDSYSLNIDGRATSGVPADRLPEVAGIDYAPTSNMAVWSDIFREVEGFNESYRRNSDVEFSARLRRQGSRLAFAPRAVIYYRRRTTAVSAVRRQLESGIASVRLYRDFREDGMGRGLTITIRDWTEILLQAPAVVVGPRERRLRWVGRAAYRVGRLAGCARYLSVFP